MPPAPSRARPRDLLAADLRVGVRRMRTPSFAAAACIATLTVGAEGGGVAFPAVSAYAWCPVAVLVVVGAVLLGPAMRAASRPAAEGSREGE